MYHLVFNLTGFISSTGRQNTFKLGMMFYDTKEHRLTSQALFSYFFNGYFQKGGHKTTCLENFHCKAHNNTFDHVTRWYTGVP